MNDQPAPSIEQQPTENKTHIAIISEPLPGIIALIKSGFSIYQQRFGVLVAIGALQAVLSIAFTLLFSLCAIVYKTNMIAGAVASLVTLVIFIWISYLLALASMEVIRGHVQMTGFVDALKLAYSRIWSFLWLILLSFLILIGASVLFAFLGTAVTMPIGLFGGGIAGIVSGIIITVIWTIAISILALWFTFSYWVFVDNSNKEVRGINVLVASRELLRGRFWAIIWRLFATVFWIYVVYMFGAFIIDTFFGTTLLKIVMGSLLTFIATLFFAPLLLSIFYSLYEAVKTHTSLVMQSTKRLYYTCIVFAIGGAAFLIAILVLALFVGSFSLHTLP